MQDHEWASASYKPRGRIALMYKAKYSDAFRCDPKPPPNDYYVAFWTLVNPTLNAEKAPQPTPRSCGMNITVSNPKMPARSAVARVIDRCAACVGVGHMMDDPTTPESAVNGATIDLSKSLFNFLYDQDKSLGVDLQDDRRNNKWKVRTVSKIQKGAEVLTWTNHVSR